MDKDKKAFLERVKGMARNSLRPETRFMESPLCGRYAAEDFERYVRENMPAVDIEKFEDHCLGCIGCAVHLIHAREKLVREQDEANEAFLLENTKKILDKLLDKEKSKTMYVPGPIDWTANTLNIVLDAVQGVWKIVNTTGEVLTPAPAFAVRGAADAETPSISLIIIQEFSKPEISVQVNVSRKEEGKSLAEISLYDRKAEVFVHGAEVRLIEGDAIVHVEMTDESGKARFELDLKQGEYIFDLLINGVQICQVAMQSKTGNIS